MPDAEAMLHGPEETPAIPAIACHYCGKFTRYEDVVWEMPYTSNLAVATEPPENVPVCHRCRNADENPPYVADLDEEDPDPLRTMVPDRYL